MDLLEMLGLRPPARTPSQVLQSVNSAMRRPPGLIEPGNINLGNRPAVKNPDGTVSTVRSMSFNDGQHEILVPTVSDDGKILSDQDAINLYQSTGQHLGKFSSPDYATSYAQKLHEDQARRYAPDPLRDFMSSMQGTRG